MPEVKSMTEITFLPFYLSTACPLAHSTPFMWVATFLSPFFAPVSCPVSCPLSCSTSMRKTEFQKLNPMKKVSDVM
jgi:hypothetical protein